MQVNFSQSSSSWEFFTDRAAIKEYLGSGLFKGIGKKTATRIVDWFGQDTFKILDSDISRLAEVEGIASNRMGAIQSAWSESKTSPERAAMLLLLGLGVSLNLSLKICQHYSSSTLDILKSNPYQLALDIDGVGFKTADELALALGIAPDSKLRSSSGLFHSLKESSSDGHCYLPMDVLIETSIILLSRAGYIPSPSEIHSVMMQLIDSKNILEGAISKSIYLPPFYRAELTVAGNIIGMTAQRRDDDIRLNNKIAELEHWLYSQAGGREEYLNQKQVLSSEQKAALAMAELEQISIITGGPGTGKTFTLQALMRRLSGKFDVALVAPTGKAAKRLANVTGHEAKTIHRLLEWSMVAGRFDRNQSNPLKENFVIVDEASMVDLFLFNSLLKALPPAGKLLLVGDQDQLPSVGPGMVLRDLINSELVPITRLTLIRRQQNGSDIITAAHQINQGLSPNLKPVNNPFSIELSSSDCLWIDAETPEQAAEEIIKTLSSLTESGFNLRSSVQVLTPMKKGAAGTNSLNTLLQSYINPKYFDHNELLFGESIWRGGDRVIQTRNDYNTGVMNGEEGEIVGVDLKAQQILVEFEGGAIAPYTASTIGDIIHAYALTIHKSQGSEYQVVIAPVLCTKTINLETEQ